MPSGPVPLLMGRYRLRRSLGPNRLVHEALDERQNVSVAIKLLDPELLGNPVALERFRREGHAVRSLSHPHIVRILDIVVAPGAAFLVMPLLRGEPLGQLAKRGRMDPARVAELGEQLIGALVAAHDAGLIHRDVKPDNVIIEQLANGRCHATLLDFGIVRAIHADHEAKLTATDRVLGTMQYMAPEQAMGEPLDGRADVYALGATLYYLLTQERPYQAAGLEASLFALGTMPAPPLHDRVPDVDVELCAIIDRALAKDVTLRWSGPAMHAALRAWLRRSSASPSSGTITVAIDRSAPDSRTLVAAHGLPRSASLRSPEGTNVSPLSDLAVAHARTLTAPLDLPPPPSSPEPTEPTLPTLPTQLLPIGASIPAPKPAPAGVSLSRFVILFAFALALFLAGLVSGRLFLFR